MLKPSPFLSLDGLTVCLDGRPLLRDVSFSLTRGEVLCVIGESGAGKTTLLKAMQGLMPARCRHFRFAPAEIDVCDEMPAQIGLPRTRWVMQDPLAALNPRQSIGKSIMESLHRSGLSEKETRTAATTALAYVELDPALFDRKPGQLSVGQAQRACLARAMIAKPDLIFFDEPLSALDALVQKKIAYQMDTRRQQTQCTYIIVTHDIGFAETYADQVLVLKDGQVAAYQSRDAFFESESDGYARDLINAADALGALQRQRVCA